MRILSLGFPLPGPPIDNFSFTSAPAFFDYDALIVDPRALSQLIGEIVNGGDEHKTFAGERIVNGSSGVDCVSLAELLRNRADETARLLARGGVVVCLAYPNAAHQGVDGFDAPFRRRGGGTELQPLDRELPFGEMLANVGAKLAYQVHFDEETPGFDGCVIGRSAGGAAVAVELLAGGGHIVLLPPPARPLDSRGRYEVSEALQEALRQTLRLASASAAPRW